MNRCPFCGGKEIGGGQRWTGGTGYSEQMNHFMFCYTCKAQGPSEVVFPNDNTDYIKLNERISAMWNKRKN